MKRGKISIAGTTVTGNTAENGAGIYINSGKVKIKFSKFDGNNATGNGGAIYITGGEVTISSECKFNTNTAYEKGGAIYAQGGTLHVTGTTFSNNKAQNGETEGIGGAIYLDQYAKYEKDELQGNSFNGNTPDDICYEDDNCFAP